MLNIVCFSSPKTTTKNTAYHTDISVNGNHANTFTSKVEHNFLYISCANPTLRSVAHNLTSKINPVTNITSPKTRDPQVALLPASVNSLTFLERDGPTQEDKHTTWRTICNSYKIRVNISPRDIGTPQYHKFFWQPRRINDASKSKASVHGVAVSTQKVLHSSTWQYSKNKIPFQIKDFSDEDLYIDSTTQNRSGGGRDNNNYTPLTVLQRNKTDFYEAQVNRRSISTHSGGTSQNVEANAFDHSSYFKQFTDELNDPNFICKLPTGNDDENLLDIEPLKYKLKPRSNNEPLAESKITVCPSDFQQQKRKGMNYSIETYLMSPEHKVLADNMSQILNKVLDKIMDSKTVDDTSWTPRAQAEHISEVIHLAFSLITKECTLDTFAETWEPLNRTEDISLVRYLIDNMPFIAESLSVKQHPANTDMSSFDHVEQPDKFIADYHPDWLSYVKTPDHYHHMNRRFYLTEISRLFMRSAITFHNQGCSAIDEWEDHYLRLRVMRNMTLSPLLPTTETNLTSSTSQHSSTSKGTANVRSFATGWSTEFEIHKLNLLKWKERSNFLLNTINNLQAKVESIVKYRYLETDEYCLLVEKFLSIRHHFHTSHFHTSPVYQVTDRKTLYRLAEKMERIVEDICTTIEKYKNVALYHKNRLHKNWLRRQSNNARKHNNSTRNTFHQRKT